MQLEDCKQSGIYNKELLMEYINNFFNNHLTLKFLNFNTLMVELKCLKCNQKHKVYIKQLEDFQCCECKRINQLKQQCIDYAYRNNINFVKLNGRFLKDGVVFKCMHNHTFTLNHLRSSTTCPICEQNVIDARKQELLSKITDFQVIGSINVNRINDITKIKCIHCDRQYNISYAMIRDNLLKPCKCKNIIPTNTRLSKTQWDKRLQELNELCSDKGKCISTEIKCYKDKLKFQCKCGNIFYMNYANAKNGAWSCKCQKHSYKTYSLNDYQSLAKIMNIEFLDDPPNHYSDKVRWKCIKHDTFFYQNYDNVKQGKISCQLCIKERSKHHSLNDYQKLALELNCSFVPNTIYEDEIWKCNVCGHTFKARYTYMYKRKEKSLVGCPKCQQNLAHEKRRKTISDYHHLSSSSNFTFIDNTIPHSINDLSKWRCNHDHEVLMSYNQVKRNKGCPICKGNTSERLCKEVLEDLLNIKLYCVRPSFLKRSDSNFPMELDMYNEKYKLAFEYQGIQHYEFRPFFQKTYEDFLLRQQHDKEKLLLCQKQGIKLIQIKYFESFKKRVTLKNVKEYLQIIIKDNNIIEWMQQFN